MKSKLLSTFSMLRFFIVAALTVFCVSCDKTETTDSTGFILHYLGVTDIGPGMSYTLQAPTYKGSAPYDFTITKVTLNNQHPPQTPPLPKYHPSSPLYQTQLHNHSIQPSILLLYTSSKNFPNKSKPINITLYP